MTSWLIALRDRPIAERERRGALAATTTVLIATATLLVLTSPAPHHIPIRHAITASNTALVAHPSIPTAGASSTSVLSPGAAVVSRAFLAGYLAYTYGHAPASKITNATPGLIRSLEAHPPRVSPGMRGDRPHVVALHPTVAPSGLLGVSVVVNDGGLIDYSVGLLLTPRDGRLLVSALEED